MNGDAAETGASVEFFDAMRSERDVLRVELDKAVSERAKLFEQYAELERRMGDEVTVLRERLREATQERDRIREEAMDMQPASQMSSPEPQGDVEKLRARAVASEAKVLALSEALKKTCEAVDRLADAVTEGPCD